MDLIDLIETRRFLGSEFMMWLWFKSETHDGFMEIPNHGTVEVIYDDSMVLEAYLAETERNTLKGGAPAYSAEAKVALQHGKRVSRAKLRVIKDGREWVFTFKAEGMDYSSIKIPAVLSRKEDDKFYERMYLVDEVEEIMDALYKEFIAVRLHDGWHDEMVPAMKTWVATEGDVYKDLYPDLGIEIDASAKVEEADEADSEAEEADEVEADSETEAEPAPA